MKIIVEEGVDSFYMCTTSVSYTHLDVYKRQVCVCVCVIYIYIERGGEREREVKREREYMCVYG